MESRPPAAESLQGVLLDVPPTQAELNYLSRLGDLDLAKEKYENIVAERDEWLSAQESLTLVGLELHYEAKEFLANFDSQQTAVLLNMAEIEEDVRRLKGKYLAEGTKGSKESNRTQDESQGRCKLEIW